MASILLPTQRWTPACEQLLAQLAHNDELLCICDNRDDPVGSHPRLRAALDDSSVDVRLLAAGEPEGCSGKANAVAYGLEHASPDQHRLILTDDDFDHGDDWLARVKRLGKHHPDRAVSGVPVFVSDCPAWQLSEPTSITLGSLGIYRRSGTWSGCITFTREILDLNADHGGVGVHTTRDLVFEVAVPGGLRAVLNRHVRNNQILYRTDPGGFVQGGLFLLVFAAASVVASVLAGALMTLYAVGDYRYLGVERWT